MIWQASSVHEPVLAAAGAGRVLGVHRRAVNLALEGGELLSLLHPSLGNGPGAVLVPGAWPLAWAPGERVRLGCGVLCGPGVSIRLDGASVWVPPAPPGSALGVDHRGVLEEVGAAVACAGNPAGLLPAALAVLGQGGAAMRPQGPVAEALLEMGLQGIRHLLAGDWEAGVARLAGLGPGSTPSGDDLLGGFACTLVRAGHREAGALGEAIRSLPRTATTALSHHLLRWAMEGAAGEHSLAFVDGLLCGRSGPAARALHPVLYHGATSGSDWASGAILAFDYLGREVSQDEAV